MNRLVVPLESLERFLTIERVDCYLHAIFCSFPTDCGYGMDNSDVVYFEPRDDGSWIVVNEEGHEIRYWNSKTNFKDEVNVSSIGIVLNRISSGKWKTISRAKDEYIEFDSSSKYIKRRVVTPPEVEI